MLSAIFLKRSLKSVPIENNIKKSNKKKKHSQFAKSPRLDNTRLIEFAGIPRCLSWLRSTAVDCDGCDGCDDLFMPHLCTASSHLSSGPNRMLGSGAADTNKPLRGGST